MRSVPRLRDLNPLRLLQSNFAYERLPFGDNGEGRSIGIQRGRRPTSSGRLGELFRCGGRLSATKAIALAITSFVVLALLVGGGYHQRLQGGTSKIVPEESGDKPKPFYEQNYLRLNSYYNGIRALVSPTEYKPGNGYNQSKPAAPLNEAEMAILPKEPPFDPVEFHPYPEYESSSYQQAYGKMQECYIDEEETVSPPNVYAYPGLPKNMEVPFFGSHKLLGINNDVCWERFGRFGPYGYGYNASHDGLGPGTTSESAGADKIWHRAGFVNYTNVDWGSAQKRCFEKNKARFEPDPSRGNKKTKRHAYILRAWAGYKYGDHQMFTLRAMINELNLKSGGEYDVHFLVHIKNNSIPIWADKETYDATLQANVPREFWNMSTLWSEKQMEMYYPDPFPTNFANMAGSSVHGVYRSAHFPLQWFSQQHPEYDFFWNWEMDLRYSGHYYEFNNRIGEWAKDQPRKGLWERGSKFYFPEYHGDWHNFTKSVEIETAEKAAGTPYPAGGPLPIWGPVQNFDNWGMLAPPNDTIPPTTYEQDNYEWGVGEDADLLTFNPLFDPSRTNWVFREDVTGYDTTVDVPPRRAAIITVARLSKRLLDIAHKETWKMRHTMFPEMWPPTVALHHGLKAVYVPHPVYFDRDWELGYMNQAFNYPKTKQESPFGWGEHNMLGGTFYYNSGFSGALWRRWLGQSENGAGGKKVEEEGMGRMCLRATLHHPVKREDGPTA